MRDPDKLIMSFNRSVVISSGDFEDRVTLCAYEVLRDATSGIAGTANTQIKHGYTYFEKGTDNTRVYQSTSCK